MFFVAENIFQKVFLLFKSFALSHNFAFEWRLGRPWMQSSVQSRFHNNKRLRYKANIILLLFTTEPLTVAE